MLEMYKYIDGKFNVFEARLAEQAVHNQRTQDSQNGMEKPRQGGESAGLWKQL